MRLALAALVLAALTSSALAQPGMTQPYGSPTYAPPPPPPTAPPAAPQPGYYGPYQPYQPQPYQPQYQYQPRPEQLNLELKSSSTAVLWSIGTTVAGIATLGAAFDEESEGLLLLGAGLTLVGPSAGHIYAGETSHAMKMSLLRAGGVLVFTLGAIEADSHSYDDCYYDDYSCDDTSDGETAMWIGGLFVLGATLYDFYDAGRAATRYNDRARQKASMQFTPTMMSKSGGGTTPGVALQGTF